MIPQHQISIWLGAIAIAIALMTPAALTSCDWMVNKLGKACRYLHLLSIPALVLLRCIQLRSVLTISVRSTGLQKIGF